MLHKNRSNKKNQLKFLLILPVLVLFLMSFNTKEIYIETESNKTQISNITEDIQAKPIANKNIAALKTQNKPVFTTKKTVANNIIKSNTISTQEIVEYLIESTFTVAQLDNVKAKLKVHGITLKIKNVKRNSNNEITALKIDAKSDNSNANFSISNDTAINAIRITYNAKNNSINIGNTNTLIHDTDYSFTHEDGAITIGKSSKSDNVFVFRSDEKHDDNDKHDKHEIIEDNDKIIIKKGNKIHEIKKLHKNKNVFTFSSGEGQTFDIISADTINSENNIFKLSGNVIVKSKGENGNIFVTSGSKGEVIELKRDGDEDGNILFIQKDKDGNIVKENIASENNQFTFKSSDGKLFKSKGKGENKVFISTNNNEKPLIIIDGKEMKNKKLEDIEPDSIESISVLKGESAEKKYGIKGKDGVIEITMKKKKN